MSKIAGLGSSENLFSGQRKDFIVMKRDTFSYTGTYTYTDDNDIDQVYDFTDCVGKMDIKKRKTDLLPVRTVSVSFDETEYNLYLSDEDMDLDAGKYYYDLQIIDADGAFVTKLWGDFIVLQDVTHLEGTVKEKVFIDFSEDITFIHSTNERLHLEFLNDINWTFGLFKNNNIFGGISTDISYTINMMPRTTVSMSMHPDVSYLRPSIATLSLEINSDITYTYYEYD